MYLSYVLGLMKPRSLHVFIFFREKSKQYAEQAAALVGLTVLGVDDGSKPDAESPNDDVTRVWRDKFHTHTGDSENKCTSDNRSNSNSNQDQGNDTSDSVIKQNSNTEVVTNESITPIEQT